MFVDVKRLIICCFRNSFINLDVKWRITTSDMLSTCVKSNINFVMFVDWLIYRRDAIMVSVCVVWCLVAMVSGMTQLHDVVYIVCAWSSTILRFNATTHQRLTGINVKDLREPRDIVACERTSQLYVADSYPECVRRVSADGADIKFWWSRSSSDTFTPFTLSVTSTRLVMTSFDTKQLMQLDSDGNELRRVQLPDYMEPRHAVESPRGSFVVSHHNKQLKPKPEYQISEVNTAGEVLRQFSGSRLSSLGYTEHVAVDSHGYIFLADYVNHHILLLDAQLRLRRVIIDKHQLNYKQPWRLCYREQTGQLLVGFDDQNSIAVFDVICR